MVYFPCFDSVGLSLFPSPPWSMCRMSMSRVCAGAQCRVCAGAQCRVCAGAQCRRVWTYGSHAYSCSRCPASMCVCAVENSAGKVWCSHSVSACADWDSVHTLSQMSVGVGGSRYLQRVWFTWACPLLCSRTHVTCLAVALHLQSAGVQSFLVERPATSAEDSGGEVHTTQCCTSVS